MITLWKWTADLSVDPKSVHRADKFILSALESGLGGWSQDQVKVTRSQLQRLIEEGRVTLDGEPLRANTKILDGALLEIRFPKPKSLEITPEDRPLEILYEDKYLLVVNKPPGLTVHPSSTQLEGTLVHALLHHIKDLSGIGGVMRPGIVHRIDKDTSGALVITKTDEAHGKLAADFAKHSIERVYWGLCYGSPVHRELRIETLIGRNPKDRKMMSTQVKEGRTAITHYRKIEEYAHDGKKPFASFLEMRLETGRTHQIRVHLAGHQHSLLGDPVYGTPSATQPKWKALPVSIQKLVGSMPGQALHARVLGFDHPVTGKKLHFEAEPPPAFRELLAELKKFS